MRYLPAILTGIVLALALVIVIQGRNLNKAHQRVATLTETIDKCGDANTGLVEQLAEIMLARQINLERAMEAERRAQVIQARRDADRQAQDERIEAIRTELAALDQTECSNSPVRPGFIDQYRVLARSKSDLHAGANGVR